MKRILSILVVLTICTFFYSCEKEREDAMACIDTGTAVFEAGETIRFMNCSKNYDLTKWTVSDEFGAVLFTEITDTLKHFVYSFNPGVFDVNLRVHYYDSTSVSVTTKRITVTP